MNTVTAIVSGGIFIVLLLGLILYVGTKRFEHIESQLESVVTLDSQKQALSSQMIYLARERTMLLNQLLFTDDAFKRDELFLAYRRNGGEFLEKRQSLTALPLNEQEQQLLNRQRELAALITEHQYDIIELSLTGDTQAAVNLLIDRAIPVQNDAIEALIELSQLQQEFSQQTLDQAASTLKRWVIQFALFFLVITIISVITVSIIVRHITTIQKKISLSDNRLHSAYQSLEHRIKQLKSAEHSLKQSQQKQQIIIDNMMDAIVTIDQNAIIQSCNASTQQMFGYSEQELLGQNVKILMPSPYREAHDGYIQRFVESGKSKVIGRVRDLQGIRKDGTIFPIDLGLSITKHGDQLEVIGVLRDITDRNKAEQLLNQSKEELEALVKQRTAELEVANTRLLQMANYDNLTGLVNRSLLNEHLKLAVASAARANNLFAILFMDLDGFKPVNDQLGHEAGDKVLQEVARRLRKCVREKDSVARFGGDEFLLLINDLIVPEDAIPVAKKVIKTIQLPLDINGQKVKIGTSIGISIYPQDSEQPEKLIQLADHAMYEVKREGKNNFQFYSE